jgi:hypothetical protein
VERVVADRCENSTNMLVKSLCIHQLNQAKNTERLEYNYTHQPDATHLELLSREVESCWLDLIFNLVRALFTLHAFLQVLLINFKIRSMKDTVKGCWIGRTVSILPKQTGQVGSSVSPEGGVDACSAVSVNWTSAVNSTWHNSACKYNRGLIHYIS